MLVICDKAERCRERRHCGGAVPHDDISCEPCPFNPDAKCVKVEDNIEGNHVNDI